jgi:hypothetical protein
MFALGSSEAPAQAFPQLDIKAAVAAADVDATAKPFGTTSITQPAFTNVSSIADAAKASATPKISALYRTPAAQTVTVALPAANAIAAAATSNAAPAIAREAAWLYKAGWPLYALVDRYSAGDTLDEQANCLATAVYFEARGETVEGQLAVARVVMNRATSGKYPASWCGVVKQAAQFSFVQRGRFPTIDQGSAAWRKAQAITRLAISNAVPSLSQDVLWYHADYVAPSWGRRLSVVQKIGTHIFYRA